MTDATTGGKTHGQTIYPAERYYFGDGFSASVSGDEKIIVTFSLLDGFKVEKITATERKTITYDQMGNKVVTSYKNDKRGNLVTTTITYDSKGNKLGAEVRTSYPERTMTNAGLDVKTYDANGRETGVTKYYSDGLKTVTEIKYDETGNAVKTTATYDSEGNKITFDEKGNKVEPTSETKMTQSYRWQSAEKVNWEGETIVTFSLIDRFTPTEGKTTTDRFGTPVGPTTTYDQMGNKVVTESKYDVQGNLVTTTTTYDEKGNKLGAEVRTSFPERNTANSLVIVKTYDANGKEIDVKSTTYDYKELKIVPTSESKGEQNI